MTSSQFKFRLGVLRDTGFAVLLVLVTTFFLLMIGRREIGEGVIALCYLVPVVWSGHRWGQIPGMAAALTGALAFDFFFVPPFLTFTIGSLEGWLVLAIFLAVAFFLVGRFESSLRSAREATYMYELSSAIGSARTQDAVAQAAARYIQTLFQAALVSVTFQGASDSTPEITALVPRNGSSHGKPDRIVPVVSAWGMVGEIRIWAGDYASLPSEDGKLFRTFAAEIAKAFDRTQTGDGRQAAWNAGSGIRESNGLAR